MPERLLADLPRSAAAAGAAVTVAVAGLRILDPPGRLPGLLDAWSWLAAAAACLLVRSLVPHGDDDRRDQGAEARPGSARGSRPRGPQA